MDYKVTFWCSIVGLGVEFFTSVNTCSYGISIFQIYYSQNDSFGISWKFHESFFCCEKQINFSYGHSMPQLTEVIPVMELLLMTVGGV